MRKIVVTLNEDGSMKIDNSKNSNEQQILAELAEIAAMLNGDPKNFKVEAHVHDHNHNHDAAGSHQHAGAAGKYVFKK